MEVLPCSRVAHIERTKKPYNNDIDYYAKRNALRAAEVWMDDFKSHVYMAWNIPMAVSTAHTLSQAQAGTWVAGGVSSHISADDHGLKLWENPCSSGEEINTPMILHF